MSENECNIMVPGIPDQGECCEYTVLHKGKWANADVVLLSDGGTNWVVKDFSRKSLPVRWTIGWVLTRREYTFLKLLDGIPGFPQHAERLNGCCLRYEVMEGIDLGKTKLEKKPAPSDYFRQLERLVFCLHRNGIVHLDLRRAANIILQKDGAPGIIDFQAAFRISWFPAWIQRILKSIDYSGIYKHWSKLAPESINSLRNGLFTTVTHRRRIWVFKGYPLRSLVKSLRCFF